VLITGLLARLWRRKKPRAEPAREPLPKRDDATVN